MPETLAACIIARDEEERLPACLDSVAFCDEVVVVDSGSRDRTMEIARAAGAKVVEHAWAGFGAQRNVALDHATADWVIEVDADERITPELAAELRTLLEAPPPGVALGMLPMRHRYLGRTLGPAGRYPFYRPRLLRRGAYRHDESRTVHEGLGPLERPWVAHSDVHHVLAGTLGEAIHDMRTYAALEARQLQGRPRSWLLALVVRPVAKLLYTAVVLGGWRDGWRGAVKLGLDATGDALVWVHRLRAGDDQGVRVAGHFSSEPPSGGPPRFVAVGTRASLARARPWLQGAEAAGAWVSAIADGAVDGLEVRAVPRLGPVHLLRALDAERQLANFDAVVALDRRSRVLLRAMPAGLRGGRDVAAATGAPQAFVAWLRGRSS